MRSTHIGGVETKAMKSNPSPARKPSSRGAELGTNTIKMRSRAYSTLTRKTAGMRHLSLVIVSNLLAILKRLRTPIPSRVAMGEAASSYVAGVIARADSRGTRAATTTLRIWMARTRAVMSGTLYALRRRGCRARLTRR